MTAAHKAPFPWLGGKSRAAPVVWGAIGTTVGHYVEPFAGGLGVMLAEPASPSRSETVCDLDGLIVNAWRAIKRSPVETAERIGMLSLSEADLTAAHISLVEWRDSDQLGHLSASLEWHDVEMAARWLHGVCLWIGSGWCNGAGPWSRTEDDRLAKTGAVGVKRKLPHLSDAGVGVHRQLPHLSNAGVGVHRQLPHLSDAGRGVHSAARQNRHGGRVESVAAMLDGLAARLDRVRIVHADWRRVVTAGALRHPNDQPVGVFLDPPYTSEVRAGGKAELYGIDDGDVAHSVRAWCAENGTDQRLRIVLAGMGTEHDDLGWRRSRWESNTTLYAPSGEDEMLWLSPGCLVPDDTPRLF